MSLRQDQPSADCRWLFGRNRRGSSATQPGSPASASPAEGTPRHDLASIEETPGPAARPVEHLSEPVSPDSNFNAPVGEPARAPAASMSNEALGTAAPPRDMQHGSVALTPSMGLEWPDDPTAELVSGWKAAASAEVRGGPEGSLGSGSGTGSRQVPDRQQRAVRAAPPLLRWAAVPTVSSPVAARQQAASSGAERSTMAQATAADPREAAAAFGSMVADTHGPLMQWDGMTKPPDSRDGQPAQPVAHVEAPMEANTVHMDPAEESARARSPGSASEPPAPRLSGSPTTGRTDAGDDVEQDSLPPTDGPLEPAIGLRQRPKSAPAGTATVATQSSQQAVAESSAQTSTTRLSALQRLKQRASRRQAATLSSSVELAQQGRAPQPAHADPVEEDGPAALVSAAAATRFGAWLQVQ